MSIKRLVISTDSVYEKRIDAKIEKSLGPKKTYFKTFKKVYQEIAPPLISAGFKFAGNAGEIFQFKKEPATQADQTKMVKDLATRYGAFRLHPNWAGKAYWLVTSIDGARLTFMVIFSKHTGAKNEYVSVSVAPYKTGSPGRGWLIDRPEWD